MLNEIIYNIKIKLLCYKNYKKDCEIQYLKNKYDNNILFIKYPYL